LTLVESTTTSPEAAGCERNRISIILLEGKSDSGRNVKHSFIEERDQEHDSVEEAEMKKKKESSGWDGKSEKKTEEILELRFH
jgi:hypothetical protein